MTHYEIYFCENYFAPNGVFNNYSILKSSSINLMISPQIQSLDNEMGLHLFHINQDHKAFSLLTLFFYRRNNYPDKVEC